MKRLLIWWARWRMRCASEALHEAMALPFPGEKFVQDRHTDLINYERRIAALEA